MVANRMPLNLVVLTLMLLTMIPFTHTMGMALRMSRGRERLAQMDMTPDRKLSN